MKLYKKFIKKIGVKNKNERQTSPQDASLSSLPSDAQARNVFSTVDENLGFIKSILGGGIGLIESNYEIAGGKVKIGVAYIESIADKEMIRVHILAPLLKYNGAIKIKRDNLLTLIQKQFISVTGTNITNKMEKVIEGLLNGDTMLFLDDTNAALIIGSRKVEKRGIEKPENESAVSGSMESFTENIETNVSMLIKRLPTPDLRFEEYKVGVLSHTKVKLTWLEGIANPKIIEEVRSRIQKIDMDNVDGIGVLSELIEDTPLSVFPTFRQTERPDVTTRNLCEGRFAVLCNNSPFAIVAPSMFWDNFKTMDDYGEKSLASSYLRIIRYMAFLISILASPLYLSFVAYNHAILATPLAFSIAAGREGVPLPSVVELIILSIIMSIIREAGLRMTRSVSYFIGTLAAVLIGQSIVTAGYVSASLIIVVAISTISSFAISRTTIVYASRLVNYFLILLAGFFGMFGLINGVAIILWHLVSMKSFGVPYFYPVVPFEGEQLKDTFIRAPYRFLKKRSKVLAPLNPVKIGNKGIKSKSKRQGE